MTGPETSPEEFDALLARTVHNLELRVAHVNLVCSGIAFLVVVAGILWGSRIPPLVAGITAGYFGWYLGVRWLLRTGRYRGWMRYASTLVDVTMGSLVVLVDLRSSGALFAASAGGPALYAVAVALATLRLEPRLCLFAGASAATQLLGVMLAVVRPEATPAWVASGAFDVFVTVLKALFLLTMGLLGMVASQSMRGLLQHLTQSAVERERMRSLFGVHVSEQVMSYLLSGSLPEGGERRTVTICFTDIRDFTTLSESRPPEEVVRLLNLYFGRMCEIVTAHGGLVNKFLGDGMLVVFGAPARQEDDAKQALAAAREMVAEAERMRASGEFPGLRIGVGLHRGEAVVGNVGGAQRQEYTVIGDTVNTASRVQDLTKALGTSLVLTRECREALGEGPFQPLGIHAVKGRQQPLELFGVGEAGAAAPGVAQGG